MKNQLLALIGVACLMSVYARADEAKSDHPKRIEKRIESQNKRIEKGVESGKLTPEQGNALKADVAKIAEKAKTEAAANGGHLSKAQRKALKKELKQESQKILEEKHPAPQPVTPSGK